ncbi:hypothetical protein I7I50_03551 [Histoplasma capsulatum G186AR]|uniref:Uncharacterized protein n=1 Tax=Ajellomyces capsulatus TaxID=5037 RepID=A0A8H8CXD1_AJECA|nr:hypothetical protein I7I52_04458 [Histoplasma capsulatum]QSS74672.1 hypothetical protein I7I50_03551 [Histoplasma capsulatum G186AR]
MGEFIYIYIYTSSIDRAGVDRGYVDRSIDTGLQIWLSCVAYYMLCLMYIQTPINLSQKGTMILTQVGRRVEQWRFTTGRRRPDWNGDGLEY